MLHSILIRDPVSKQTIRCSANDNGAVANVSVELLSDATRRIDRRVEGLDRKLALSYLKKRQLDYFANLVNGDL